jgi:hypothetical protein
MRIYKEESLPNSRFGHKIHLDAPHIKIRIWWSGSETGVDRGIKSGKKQ